MRIVPVIGGGVRSYEVVIGRRLLDDAASQIAPILTRPRLAVVSDETVAALQGPRLLGALAAAGIDVERGIL